jgi:hypothetical protein
MSMQSAWEWAFRISGVFAGISGALFLSLPSSSGLKRIAGIACAAFVSICLISTNRARKSAREERAEEVRAARREIEHFGDDALDD